MYCTLQQRSTLETQVEGEQLPCPPEQPLGGSQRVTCNASDLVHVYYTRVCVLIDCTLSQRVPTNRSGLPGTSSGAKAKVSGQAKLETRP